MINKTKASGLSALKGKAVQEKPRFMMKPARHVWSNWPVAFLKMATPIGAKEGRIAAGLGVSQSKVQRILSDHDLKPIRWIIGVEKAPTLSLKKKC